MRRLIILIVVLALAGYAIATLTTPTLNYGFTPETSATRQMSYSVIHTVTADDTALAPATKYWDNIKTSTQPSFIPIFPQWNVVEVSFYCYGDGTGTGDPNGATFDFKIYAVRLYGCAKTVYEGHAHCGELELSCSPVDGTEYYSGALDPNQCYKWVDTIDPNGLGSVWISSVVLSGDAGADTTGEIATLSFDLNGYYGLWCEITAMTTKPVTQIWALVSGY